MADALPRSSGTEHRKQCSSLRPAKVDMTPLVDLAFLLLTFFILTSKLSQPTALQLTAPVPGPPTAANNVLTVLLAERDALFAYTGPFDPAHTVLEPLDGPGLRKRLLAFVQGSPRSGPPPVCILKPVGRTRYGRVIDVMDEVIIAGIGRYAVQDSLLPGESVLIEQARLGGRVVR